MQNHPIIKQIQQSGYMPGNSQGFWGVIKYASGTLGIQNR